MTNTTQLHMERIYIMYKEGLTGSVILDSIVMNASIEMYVEERKS